MTLRRRGIAAQKYNRPADAVSDFRESISILRGLKSPSPVNIYDIACGQSQLAGLAQDARSGLTADEGRVAMAAAIAALREAIGAGWHNPALIRSDPGLDPIRSRPDFQMLVADVEFPDDPFAPSDPMTGPASPARSRPAR
jgi:serine/threonine-protein kinase